MSVPGLRNLACWIMIAVVPMSLWAADSGAAMLYAKGATWINGSAVPRTSAVFAGDMVQTKSDSIANINASGSSVMILSDSLVKFEGPAVSLERGSVTVATSKGMTTRAGEVTVVPASNGWTEFEVQQDPNGMVQVVAQKGDVNVSDGSGTATLSQGQKTTVDDSQEKRKKKRRKAAGAIPAGGGSILDSPIVIYGGAGAVGGLVTWVLLKGSDPVSPDIP